MAKEFKNTFSWSVSRDNVFRECLRKYYYSYYGFWNGWKKDAPPVTRELYVLNQLKNRATWIGQTVHDCIARSLQNFSRGVPVLKVEEILEITRNLMRRDFRQSRDGMYWNNPKDFCGLFEHEYQADVSDAEWKETADSVDRCLKNFYESPVFEELAALAPHDYLEVEKFSEFRVEDMEMRIKLDCATRGRDNVIVWDWKTGRRESNIGLSVQMACYGFYARQTYKTPLDKIITRRVDLYRSKVYEQTISERSLAENLTYVRGSIKDMLGLLDNVEKNDAVEERFRKVEQETICLRCNFLKVCKPEL